MTNPEEPIVLMADDDDDDRFLLTRAARKTGYPIRVFLVQDGGELMDYLRRRNRYNHPSSAPRPDLILLDLNMPVKTGWEALEEIKGDESLRSIPVVIWSTSSDREQFQKATRLGACDYVVKPETFQGLIDVLTRVLADCT